MGWCGAMRRLRLWLRPDEDALELAEVAGVPEGLDDPQRHVERVDPVGGIESLLTADAEGLLRELGTRRVHKRREPIARQHAGEQVPSVTAADAEVGVHDGSLRVEIHVVAPAAVERAHGGDHRLERWTGNDLLRPGSALPFKCSQLAKHDLLEVVSAGRKRAR